MRHYNKTPLRKDELMKYDKPICITIIIAFIFAFVAGFFISVGPSYASVNDDGAAHTDTDLEAVSVSDAAADDNIEAVSDNDVTADDNNAVYGNTASDNTNNSSASEQDSSASSGSDSDTSASHHALYYELSAKADSILQQLKSIPDTQDEAELITIRQTCLTAYTEYSELFDKADEAYDEGTIDTAEYAELIELLNSTAEELSAQFDRFGFDPYAVSQSYYIGVTSSNIAKYVPTYEWSASYNGSNLIINFNFHVKNLTNNYISTIYVGQSGQLLKVNAYGYNHATSDITKALQYFKSNFGTVALTSVNIALYFTKGTGTITITDAAGFKSWYNAGSRQLWWNTYSDTGTDYEYYPDSTTGMNPTTISNISTALTQATCSHSYVCTSVNASTHQTACKTCGYVKSTDSHNRGTVDTSTKTGYTITKCSACSYVHSTVANSYTVTIDMCTGSTSDNLSVKATYNSAMPAVKVPSRSGYKFMGIYSGTNGSGTQYYTDTGASARAYNIASATKLYAYWKRLCDITVLPVVENDFACTSA